MYLNYFTLHCFAPIILIILPAICLISGIHFSRLNRNKSTSFKFSDPIWFFGIFTTSEERVGFSSYKAVKNTSMASTFNGSGVVLYLTNHGCFWPWCDSSVPSSKYVNPWLHPSKDRRSLIIPKPAFKPQYDRLICVNRVELHIELTAEQ